jgi:poly-gamma-glutamate synthesis protein (capsule biosynthesis protein)
VRERAAAGHFRDIARWLNQPLAPHGIFVQVQSDRPGCLLLLVEYQQPPIQEHLLRFLCHRVWLLNSELIEGIAVVARPLGHRRVTWQRRVKIVTPALRQRRRVTPTPGRSAKGSPMPPRIKTPRATPGLSRQRVQTLRAFLLTGSAVAAFVMGCLLEVILAAPSPSLPQFSASSDTHLEGPLGAQSGMQPEARTQPQPVPVAIPVRGRDRPTPAANRPTVVDAALEPVGVITHQPAAAVPSDDVTLLFGGDIDLEAIAPDTLGDPGGFFAEVAEVGLADLSLVNLATPLTAAATNLQEELRHQSRTDAAELLVDSGVDIVNLTHSRLMDYGAEGLDDTLTTLDSKGLYRIGAGRNALEARRPEILDVKGKRIAYLSYAMGGNNAAHDTDLLKERAGADDGAIAKEVERFKTATAFKDRAGFNAQNMPEIVADIQALRSEVDWIVVNFRWVDHLSEQPNFMQTNLARLAIDQGADVVVGYHPTVIQGGEIYKGRPIAYSLGDFVFQADEPVENQDSAVLKVSLKDEQMRVELVPVQVRDSRPKTLEGKPGEAVLQRIEQASSQFDKPLTSPLVLDLAAPQPDPEAASDPTSPFVSPSDNDVLPVAEPPSLAEPAEAGAESPAETPDKSVGEPAAPALESSPAVEPAAEPEVEIDFGDELDNWGPKTTPEHDQFEPVPPQRSGVAPAIKPRSQAVPKPLPLAPEAEAPGTAIPQPGNSETAIPLPRPHLWGEPVATAPALEVPALAAPQAADLASGGWSDAVPATPVPGVNP